MTWWPALESRASRRIDNVIIGMSIANFVFCGVLLRDHPVYTATFGVVAAYCIVAAINRIERRGIPQ